MRERELEAPPQSLAVVRPLRGEWIHLACWPFRHLACGRGWLVATLRVSSSAHRSGPSPALSDPRRSATPPTVPSLRPAIGALSPPASAILWRCGSPSLQSRGAKDTGHLGRQWHGAGRAVQARLLSAATTPVWRAFLQLAVSCTDCEAHCWPLFTTALFTTAEGTLTLFSTVYEHHRKSLPFCSSRRSSLVLACSTLLLIQHTLPASQPLPKPPILQLCASLALPCVSSTTAAAAAATITALRQRACASAFSIHSLARNVLHRLLSE